MSRPTRVDESFGRRPGESDDDWFRRVFGPMPAATVEPTADPAPTIHPRLRRASASLERSIPRTYAWATLDAPELSERVYMPAIGIGKIAYRESRVCLMGSS